MTDPFSALHFRVEIVLPGARRPLCDAAFAECDGLEMAFEHRRLHEGGGGQRLLAGPVSHGLVRLRRGMTSSLDLWDWCGAVARDPALRADARVVVLAPDGKTERAGFRLRGCLPARLKAPRLDALDGILALEELHLAFESLAVERPGGKADEAPEPQRAELRELDASFKREINAKRRVPVPVNPESLRITYEPPAGARLALELWFDGAADVRRLTERVAYFVDPEPRPVRFAWGSFRFDGRMEALEESLELFSADGRPLHARLSVAIIRA